MNEPYTDYFIDWYKFLQKHIAHVIVKDKEALIELDNTLNRIADENQGSEKKVFDKRQQALFDHIEHLYDKRPSQIALKSLATDFFEERDFFLRKLPETEEVVQLVNRFRRLATDSNWNRFRKRFKIAGFYFTKVPFYVANVFRQEKLVLSYWSHSIPVKALVQRCFINSFYDLWAVIENERAAFFLARLKHLKQQDSQVEEDIKTVYDAFKEKVGEKITAWYEQQSNMFHAEYELVDTIEFKDKYLSNSHLERSEEEKIEEWEDVYRRWYNTTHASFEDWRSQLELSALKAYVAFQREEMASSMNAWYQQLESDYLSAIDTFLMDCLSHFSEEKLVAEEIKRQITHLNYQTKKQLDQGLLKAFEKKLSENSLLNQLDRFEHLIDSRINALEDEHVVVKVQEFDQPLNDNELSEISNYELLSFEISPIIDEKIEKLKNELFTRMSKLLVAVGDIDEIVNYVLSTASNALEEEVDIHEIQHILKEGYERALNANNEIKQQLSAINKLAETDLQIIEATLVKDVDELSKKENIAALKMRINKAKAIRKSEDLSKKLLGHLSIYTTQAKDLLLKQYHFLLKQLQSLNKRFLSINVADQPQRAVSDFLNESNKAIGELPLIYRRLYAIEPLQDIVLFEGRKAEISRFNEAYAAWNEGKYGDVIFSGEKWSGVTSLINYLLKTTKFKHAFKRMSFKNNNTDTGAMLQQFATLFNKEPMSSKEELIAYLNSGPKRIIILEDLQKLYLRKIGGQQALNEVIEIIAATQRQIFWVVSVSLYAYKYLDKTVKLSAFFSYPILLGNMDFETISQLIVKRNRVSGFKINFEPSAANIGDKKFMKLEEEAQQEYLRNKFFKELQNFSKSNISMALMYWLLSTKSVSGHSIIIKPFEKPDFSFLNSLQADRVFVLNALIMHDGLTTPQLAEVLNMANRKARFLIIEMLEDGILIQEGSSFLVNPIIFKNTIELLKDKNLLN
jgi:hypothetical protein